MFTIADAIGIKLVSAKCLLTGIGNELHQYCIDPSAKTHHARLNLEFKSKIYGIRSLSDALSESSSRFVIVYGGKELAVLTNVGRPDVHVLKCLAFSDWISTVHVYERTESNSVRMCVLTAHSLAMEIEVDETGAWKISSRSASVDKSTLYCSMAMGSRWSTTTVFGGTALGELIIWSVQTGDLAREIIHRISGHNGVIFSIDCDLRHDLLTTTSDDRSVKIWAVSFADQARDWHSSSLNASKSMYGHTARIFAHKIIEFGGEPYVVSIGEDANVCIWTRDGQLLSRQSVGGGQSALWSLDWDPVRCYLVTSGSGGNVNQIPIAHILHRDVYRTDIIETALSGGEDEHFAKIRVMQADGLLIGVTNRQNLFYRHIDDSDSAWRSMDSNGSTTSYKSTLLEVQGSMAAVAGYKRATIFCFRDGVFETLLDESFSNGMIRSLKFLDSDAFVVCDDNGNATLCSLKGSSKVNFTLPACKERWITVAHRYGQHLIVGDRCGHLHLYVIDGDGIAWKSTLRHLHGSLGCTSVYFESSSPTRRVEFKTAGHDGTLKTIWLDEQQHTIALKFTHRIPIAWTDKIVSLNDGERIVAGFNDNHFIAVRPKCDAGDEVHFEYECGGGHRFWDLYVDDCHARLKCHFYYIRTKRVHRVQFRLDRRLHPFAIVRFDWHHRPCNAVHNIQLPDGRVLLASGGDDNLLKFNVCDGATTPRHVIDVSAHISNIKAICAAATTSAWLIFSAGGRAQICVTQVTVDGDDGVQFCERVDFMLRMNDLQRKRLGKSQHIDFDPETRFMSMAVYEHDAAPATWWLIVACSDGLIRRFVYDDRASTIALDSAVLYGRCILHVHRLHSKSTDDDVLLSMATDGRIVFWQLNAFGTEKPFYELTHHDSGINSYDVLTEDDGSVHIATGGDDQSVVISRVKVHGRSVNVEKTVRFPYAHTAQVNGVRFRPFERALYSVSVDQMVFRFDLNDFTATKVAYTCVSDAKGIEAINEDCILAYGCGAQLLSISSNK